MAIHTLNDGAEIRAPKPWDQKEGYWDSDSNSWKPFNDVGHALSLLVEAYRFIGLTVPVMKDGEQREYWFVGGVDDEHFILKTTTPTLYFADELPNDNLGENGDIYYYDKGSGIDIYQKEDGEWGTPLGTLKKGATVTEDDNVSFGITSAQLDGLYPDANPGDVVWSEANQILFMKLEGGKWDYKSLSIA